MSKGGLIDEHVSLAQCRKAVEALHSHELKRQEKFEENQILPAKEQHVWLNVTVKTITPGTSLKPRKIPIVHPLVDPRTTPICLITKDPQREYKDLLETHKIKFISRVVGIEKLKGKFKPFEARRMLLKENGMFLADERVVTLLPKLLGSKWFEAKKQPIPVCLTRKDLKGELERAISSTYMNQNQGTCISIKIGKMSQEPSQIVDNIKTALPTIAKFIKGGWDNLQSFNIKTNSSVSLPIWSCTLDDAEGGRWHGLQAEEKTAEEEEEEEEGEAEEVAQKVKKSTHSKSRKRSSSHDHEEEGEEEKPKKKVKAGDGALKPKEKTNPGETSMTAVVGTPQAKSTKSADSSKPLTQVNTSTIAAEKNAKKGLSKSIPAPSTPPTVGALSKKMKTSTTQLSSDTASSRKSTSSPTTSTTPSGTTVKLGKKEKEKASSKVAEVNKLGTEKPAKATVSKEEVKQKLSSSVFEKKKQLITKAKGGRSAKNAVLGKKVAQS